MKDVSKGESNFNRTDEIPIDFDVIKAVKDFVFDIHDSMRRSQILEEMEVLYSQTFLKLSEDYYKNSPWPASEVIASQCDNDENFLLFYNEMRMRHINVSNMADLIDRFDAWTNYCNLFDLLLKCADTDFMITSTWAFDIINEFVYQFQSFCQYRTRETLTEEETQLLVNKQDVWAIQNVLEYLHGLINVSQIEQILKPSKGKAGVKSPSQMHKMMGYYAIIGLSRLHCLVADYHECLNVLSALDIADRNSEFRSNPNAYISLYRHMGISFMMLKRYSDSARVLSEIVIHLNRSMKSGLFQKAGNELIPKQYEKILSLVAILIVLAPNSVSDVTVLQIAMDVHRDKVAAIAEGGDSCERVIRDLFRNASPKYIVCSMPSFKSSSDDMPSNSLNDQQMFLFCREAKQHLHFPKLRSYLKLYATISASKLARFNGMEEKEFLASLISMKQKAMQIEWAGNSAEPPLNGSSTFAMDFNYFVEDGVIVIDEHAHEKRFEKYFLDQIDKCNDVIAQVGKLNI